MHFYKTTFGQWICLKFGTLVELNVLYRLTLTALKYNVLHMFKVKSIKVGYISAAPLT